MTRLEEIKADRKQDLEHGYYYDTNDYLCEISDTLAKICDLISKGAKDDENGISH